MLRPFPGLVVDPAWADRVTTGPYDAYSPTQRAAIAEANPYSFLNVTRSQEDVPPGRRDDIDGLIAECAGSMQRIYDAGAYVPHDAPSLFLYRLATADHVQTGIMGLVPVTEPGDRRVLRHEAVRPGRANLLTRHLLEVGMSSSPISLTYRTDDALDAVVAACCNDDPVLESTSDGVHQMVWAVSGAAADTLANALGERPLYVTDGHHRLAAAVEARTETPASPTTTLCNGPRPSCSRTPRCWSCPFTGGSATGRDGRPTNWSMPCPESATWSRAPVSTRPDLPVRGRSACTWPVGGSLWTCPRPAVGGPSTSWT
ncbi:MAG: hypothetical protein Ct9H300mP31_06120 [Acidimicrobiaceae bacterium]|nr:MAG: hypothetical protein Ct9H300mP31_06120 [Acidimicrobiaceae bacterium]